MLETCYCGRTGELEDRNLVSDDTGGRVWNAHSAGTWTISPGFRTRRACSRRPGAARATTRRRQPEELGIGPLWNPIPNSRFLIVLRRCIRLVLS